jgi:hypothetical protein
VLHEAWKVAVLHEAWKVLLAPSDAATTESTEQELRSCCDVPRIECTRTVMGGCYSCTGTISIADRNGLK